MIYSTHVCGHMLPPPPPLVASLGERGGGGTTGGSPPEVVAAAAGAEAASGGAPAAVADTADDGFAGLPIMSDFGAGLFLTSNLLATGAVFR